MDLQVFAMISRAFPAEAGAGPMKLSDSDAEGSNGSRTSSLSSIEKPKRAARAMILSKVPKNSGSLL